MLWQILHAALSNPLNSLFTSVTLGLAACAMLGVFLRSGPLHRLSGAAPGLLTAIGVLGTFVGILVGLIGFDVSDISRSVPQLLEGMKTAFVTSVFGMGSGIVVKLASELAARGEGADEPKGVEDVLSALGALRQEEVQTRQDLAGALERMRLALTGDAESSLVTQLQRLRNDVTDEIKVSRQAHAEVISAISAEIQKISTTLTESTSKAIIEALEGSIRDFNQKITEQFGDNFKQLNIAVGRLLEWQENYRQQMQANAEALREGADGLQAARAGLEAIGGRAAALVRAASDMQHLLDGLGNTKAELDARLQSFQQMAQAAIAAMPIIQVRIEELTSGFATQVEAATRQVSLMADSLRQESERFVGAVGEASSRSNAAAAEAAAEQRKMLGELSQGYGRMREDAAAIGADLRHAIEAAGDALRASLRDSQAELQQTSAEHIRAIAQQLQNTTNDEFRRIAIGLDDQVKQLDDAMKKELERALTALGSQLVSLTGQFVEDYSVLTRRMREAVNDMRNDAA
ncbi:hypothetical protein [Teichococcus aestuarii]|uniref:hypothetical protein n=1 Tax=Teichococcus aestuarii TaxID=568898 RepID=UPI003623EA1D